MRIAEFFERPIVTYIVMVIFSAAVAMLFFQIGGSFAKITGREETLIGLSFEAGGALAGFLITFWISVVAIRKLRKITPEEKSLLREYILRPRADSFDPTDQTLVCSYMLFDTDTGVWGEWKNIAYTREAGGLKIHVREMEDHHIIRIRLSSAQNKTWESEEDHPYGVSPISFKRVGAT